MQCIRQPMKKWLEYVRTNICTELEFRRNQEEEVHGSPQHCTKNLLPQSLLFISVITKSISVTMFAELHDTKSQDLNQNFASYDGSNGSTWRAAHAPAGDDGSEKG